MQSEFLPMPVPLVAGCTVYCSRVLHQIIGHAEVPTIVAHRRNLQVRVRCYRQPYDGLLSPLTKA